jgi:hypothetical protein
MNETLKTIMERSSCRDFEGTALSHEQVRSVVEAGLAAQSLGLGDVICGMAWIPFSGPRGDELKKRLQFPAGFSFGIAVLIGKAKSGKTPHEWDMGKVTYIK